MATIKIQRTSELNNRLRDFRIYIDGGKIGTIKDGETKDFVISSGQHSIVAKIDWCSSPEISFNIKDADTKTFKVGGFESGNKIVLITIGLIALYFILKVLLQKNYAIFLLLPVPFILGYYIIVERKKYLILTEIEISDLEKDKITLPDTDNK
jgi:hypothetical protein